MTVRRADTLARPSCEPRVCHACAKDVVFAVLAQGTGQQLVNLVDGTAGVFSGSTKPTWAGPFLNLPGGAASVSWVDWGASKQALTRDLAMGPLSIVARVLWRSGAGGFAERSDGNALNAGWEVGVTASGNVGLIFVRASTDLNAFGPALPSNKWVSVAICYPGTLVSADVKFYLNGVVQAHTADQNGSGAQGSDFAFPMTVGRQSFLQVGAPAGTFNGWIDALLIYRRYLRAEDVRALAVDPYGPWRPRRLRSGWAAGAAPAAPSTTTPAFTLLLAP